LTELTISVIVTNWKRQKFIPSIAQQLAEQHYPKDQYEVIIVDDNSPDLQEVYKIVRESAHSHPDMHFRLFETHKNVTLNPVLRYNIGARNSKGDVLLFNESDVLMQGEYLQQVNSRHLANNKLWLGPELINAYSDGSRVIQTGRGACDLGSSIRKEHFFAVRGFDERTRGWGGIESDLQRRLRNIGVNYEKDPSLQMLHRQLELVNIDKKSFFSDVADYMGLTLPDLGTTPNPETWGTLDTLKEILL